MPQGRGLSPHIPMPHRLCIPHTHWSSARRGTAPPHASAAAMRAALDSWSTSQGMTAELPLLALNPTRDLRDARRCVCGGVRMGAGSGEGAQGGHKLGYG